MLRQRSGLHSQASSILDTCLSITDLKITVKQPSRDKKIGEGLDSINATYEVFSVLSKKDKKSFLKCEIPGVSPFCFRDRERDAISQSELPS